MEFQTYKAMFLKWLFALLTTWSVLEVCYQVYLHKTYVRDGVYEWDRYVGERNAESFRILDGYFSKRKDYFYYSNYPPEGELNSIPDSVKCAIITLKRDLIGGLDLLHTRQHFSIIFDRMDTVYSVIIFAGATFHDSDNGYHAYWIITDDSDPSNDYEFYKKVVLKHLYVNMKKNVHPHNAVILKYNCNSPDLLLLKLFR